MKHLLYLQLESFDRSQLSPEDVNLLDELAQDVHLWPLLLSLIRGQLFHHIKRYHLHYHKAILDVQGKLYNKGLTAFDKNNIESINKGRKLAVEACIEMSLELLSKSLSDNIKTFVLFNGIGMSLQTAVLHKLWNISKQEAEDVIDTLWAYGLAKVTNSTISPNFNSQSHLEIHAVISQYIMECMDSNEVLTSPVSQKLITWQAVNEGLQLSFMNLYRVHNQPSLTATEYLKYQLSTLENIQLSVQFRTVNISIVYDSHIITGMLQGMQNLLSLSSGITLNLITILFEELDSLKAKCKRTAKNAHILCRKLNQNLQRILYEKEYDKLIPTIQEFMRIYPLCNIAEKGITIVKTIIPYCEGEVLDHMNTLCECLYTLAPNYHQITALTIPFIELHIKHIKKSPVHLQMDHLILNGHIITLHLMNTMKIVVYCMLDTLSKYKKLLLIMHM